MLAACSSQLTLTGAGTAERVADMSRRALTGEATHADYLACHAAVLADAGELVEDVLARRDSQESRSAESAVADLALSSQLALSRGELATAYAAAADGLSLAADVRPSPAQRRLQTDLLAARVLVDLARGDDEAAATALAQLDDAADDRDPIVTGLRVASALRRSEPAVELAGQGEPEAIGIIAPARSLRSWAALAHHAAGEQARALALATEHLELARAWGGASLLGRALVVRGLVGSHAERLGLLEEAVAVLEDSPAQLELAYATVELGSALRRARRTRDARAHLTHGGDLAHQCGADALVARVRAELVAAGARPRRAAFSGVSSLTDAERRVAVLAASGMTTRAIAQELIVSPKTVSGQLGAVYSKLDVHDRAALAAAMSADGESAQRERVH